MERATINLKPTLVILFVISARFSRPCVVEAMTKEALQSSAAAHGTHSFSHMRDGLSWQSPSPVPCKGLPAGLASLLLFHPCSWSSLDKNKNSSNGSEGLFGLDPLSIFSQHQLFLSLSTLATLAFWKSLLNTRPSRSESLPVCSFLSPFSP